MIDIKVESVVGHFKMNLDEQLFTAAGYLMSKPSKKSHVGGPTGIYFSLAVKINESPGNGSSPTIFYLRQFTCLDSQIQTIQDILTDNSKAILHMKDGDSNISDLALMKIRNFPDVAIPTITYE